MQRTGFQVPPILFPTFPDEDTTQHIMHALRLPTDHFSVARALVEAAASFVTGSPNDYHPGYRAELRKGLDSICGVVVAGVEIKYIGYVWYALQIQGIALFLRYTIFGHQDDLDRYRQLQETIGPGDEPSRSLFTGSLGLNACLAVQSEPSYALRPLLLPVPIPVIASQTMEAATDLLKIPLESRSSTRRAQIITNIDMIITVIDNAIEWCDPDDDELPQLSSVLFVQGDMFFHRYLLLGNSADITRSIFLLDVSRCFDDASVFKGPSRSSVRVLNALLHHYEAVQDPTDTDRIFEIGECILSSPRFESIKEQIWTSLTTHLSNRLDAGHNVEDGYQFLDKMLPFATTEEGRSWCMNYGARIVCELSWNGQKVADWRKGLYWVESGMPRSIGYFLLLQLRVAVIDGDEEMASELEQEIFEKGHSDFAFHLLPLSLKDSDADLDNTIDVFEDRRRLCSPNDHIKHQAATLVLFVSLYARYKRARRVLDLRDAFNFRMSTSLPKFGAACLDLVLLGSCQNDLDPGGTTSILEEARRLHVGVLGCEQCLTDPQALSRESEPELRPGVGGLRRSSLWVDVSWQSHVPPDDRGSSSYKSNPTITPTGDLSLSRGELHDRIRSWVMIPFNLKPSVYDGQSQYTERPKEVFNYLEQLRGGLKEGDQHRDEKYCRMLWAQGLLCFSDAQYKFEDSVTVPSSQIRLALDYLREFASDELHIPHQERLFTISYWFFYLSRAREENKGHVLSMAWLALSLMQEQRSAAMNARTSIDTRMGTSGLLIRAVIETIFSGGVNVVPALQILDAGQSLLWRQVPGARNPTIGSTSIDRFAAESAQVESQQTSHAQSLIRPNLWEDLIAISSHGPVVILFPGPPVAVIIRKENSVCIPLPEISSKTIQELHKVLRLSVRTRAGDGPPSGHGEDDADGCYTDSPVSSQVSDAGDPRSLRRNIASKDDTATALEVLWRGIALPVLKEILGNGSIPGIAPGVIPNSDEEIAKPDLKNRPRIWWCCLGELSFMPIHAAGIYRNSSPICVSDFFVSSYTPSIGALLDAWEHMPPSLTSHFKVLAAVQPNPGHGWSRLPEVGSELREILGLVPRENLVGLSTSGEQDFNGIHATVKNVVDKLPEANILHLACHGTQDAADPLSSGFILANGERLTIEELMKHNLPNAHIAILSACHTASNDTGLPEDSINLASAMLSVGFRSVLATKWPMCDLDGPIVAKAVYSRLRRLFPSPGATNGEVSGPEEDSHSGGLRTSEMGPVTPDSETPAPAHWQARKFSLTHVVDEVTRDLRVNKKLPVARWATFVHVGV